MNQQTAQGLAALGRGPDSMLVHMAPGEVKSLQQLAMAHGGSLTINPETGLPEAGFLSSILPMMLGAGAMMIPGLQGVGAAGIGLGIGGLQALRTGSLKKGLMAGLGAYGGAGLGSALAGAGGANLAAAGGVNAANIAGPAVPPAEMINPSNVTASAGQKMLAGVQGLGSEAGRNTFMSQIGGGKGLMKTGLMAAAPMMMETTTKQPEIKQDTSMGQRYQFNAGAQTPTPIPDVPGYGNQGLNFGKERQYFNPSYTAIDDATAKKQFGFASGGPIQDMSNANNMAAYMGLDKFAEGGEVDEYTYDPVTQMYTKKGGAEATMVSPINEISGASGSSGSDTYTDPNPGWSGKTSSEKAEFYAKPENELIQDLSLLGLKGYGLTKAGLLQNFFVPDFVKEVGTYTRGIDPGTGLFAGAGERSQTGLHGDKGVSFNPDGSVKGYDPSIYGDPVSYDPVTFDSVMSSHPGTVSGGGDTGYSGGTTGAGNDSGGTYSAGEGLAQGGLSALARGGISHLGDYSDGGRLLRGPGDGISDSIPAMIGKKQPARLADGEFVVPARIVSELGNGSTEAGARKLYAMMDRVQKARGKTVGKGKVAANSRAAKYLPA